MREGRNTGVSVKTSGAPFRGELHFFLLPISPLPLLFFVF
jgi:hypothetical protein